MTTFKSASELTPPQREALQALLLALADTKLLLGFHYGEWTFGTPALEASVAACSMSQDEFGHLRLLHACLTSQFGMSPQDLLERRALNTFANVPSLDQALSSWADFVAINLLTDGAMTALLSALQRSAFEPVSNFMDKMVAEEKHHLRNAQGWTRSLAAAGAQTKASLEASGQRVLRATCEWLGPQTHEAASVLVSAGILNTTWQQVQQNFLDWIGAFAVELGLNFNLKEESRHWQLREAVNFTNWNPKTRRCAATQPEEKLLYHLRGSKNAMFKLGEA
ncbi:MAG: Phenylacetic acid catabolic protein [candidate division KSB1 bacterium]